MLLVVCCLKFSIPVYISVPADDRPAPAYSQPLLDGRSASAKVQQPPSLLSPALAGGWPTKNKKEGEEEASLANNRRQMKRASKSYDSFILGRDIEGDEVGPIGEFRLSKGN